MNRTEYLHLLGERSSLESMLQKIPEDDVLDRMSIESRLEKIKLLLAQTQITEKVPAKARLTFNGRPVIGTHGIFADFGMKAVNSFNDAVSAVAASLSGTLAAMGPIPNRDQTRLLITATAKGSFGFELEEHQPEGQLEFAEQTPVEESLERILTLLSSTLSNDDEQLADSATELDQRALDKIRSFIKTLDEHEAVCALQYADRQFRFRDRGEVQHSLARLSQDNLHEEEQTLTVRFVGALPHRRSCEFMIADTKDVLLAKISPAAGEPDVINQHLKQPTEAKFIITRVGQGRPRYVLISAPAW